MFLLGPQKSPREVMVWEAAEDAGPFYLGLWSRRVGRWFGPHRVCSANYPLGRLFSEKSLMQREKQSPNILFSLFGPEGHPGRVQCWPWGCEACYASKGSPLLLRRRHLG